MGEVQVSVVVENRAGGRGLLAEHGLSLWVEASGSNVLFDTGQGMALSANAEALGIDLATADALVLSHGHYDHTGGLGQAAARLGRATVYVHPCAFEMKFGRWGSSGASEIGSPTRSVDQIRPHVSDVVFTASPTKVAEGVWVTGEIPRRNAFEDTGGPFFLDEACTVPDPLADDQAMYIESGRGLVVLMGCGHAGVVNTLEYVTELAGADRVHALLGGMHLVQASDERIVKTLEALQGYDVQVIAPVHCTGREATMRFWERFPNRCVECATGSRFVFD